MTIDELKEIIDAVHAIDPLMEVMTYSGPECYELDHVDVKKVKYKRHYPGDYAWDDWLIDDSEGSKDVLLLE